MRRFIVITLSLSGLVLLGLFLGRDAPAAAAGPTPECGPLATATWTLAGSPYVVCTSGASVPATATLTIQPGVTVQFSTTASLQVAGSISAIGTVTQPITFTGVTAAAGSWHGLLVDHTVPAPAAADLAYITFDYGGANANNAEISIDRGVLTLTHGLVRHSLGSGLDATSGAHISIDTTSFVSNGQDALRLHDPIHNLPLTNLTASGNLTDAVHIEGLNTNLVGNLRWSNPGLPYVIDVIMHNNPGDQLTIDPGTEMRFGVNDGLAIGGQLSALGLAGQPITFTAQTKAPGMWRGIFVSGGSIQAAAQLDYVTVEYGGGDIGGANIALENGTLSAHHSRIQFSAKDGVQFGSNSGGSVLSSQILSNSQVLTGTHAVFNATPTRAVLATNDWWGDPAGPQSDQPSCSTGHGGRVSTGVLFRPVLTSTNTAAEFPLSNDPQLTLTPRRWFAPADGVAQIFFDITLRDGNGTPLPGRQVHLTAAGATIHDGGFTDATGHALAFITSQNTGDIDVSASLVPSTACEAALSPVSRVTFTPAVNLTDLFPDSPAPYVSYDLSIAPLPLVANIPSTLSARLTNPLTVPITVDVHFGIAQSSVGLAFGNIADFNGQVIAPHATRVFQTPWTPPVSGHYCIQVGYSIVSVGAALGPLAPASGPQLKQWNENVQPGPTSPPDANDALNKADKIFGAGKHLAPATHQVMLGGWWDAVYNAVRNATHELGLDPPRQDYTTISLPISTTWPAVQPGPGVTAQRAAAINAASDALVNVLADGQAAAIALDRYSGASQAGDLTWEAQQASAQQFYQQQMGADLMTYADRLDALVQEVQNEPYTDTVVTLAEAVAFQTRLQNSGFTQQELADAHNAGLSSDDIAAYKQELLAANPSDLAGNLVDLFTSEATDLRAAGGALLHPYNYAPGYSVSGTAGLEPSASSGNSMVQIYNTISTIQVGNPLSVTSAIDLRPRRLNLPADWAVQVSPAQVTLAPGTQTTVTVTVVAGSPLPQGSLPQVAVEGYAGSTLLGGVLVDIVAPNYALFDGHLHLYLPIVRR